MILIVQAILSILGIPLSESICYTAIRTILSDHHLSTLTSCRGRQQSHWSSTSSSVNLSIPLVHLNRRYWPFVRFICLRHLLHPFIVVLCVYIYLFDLVSFFFILLLCAKVLLMFICLLYVIINHKVWVLGYIFLQYILCIFIFKILSLFEDWAQFIFEITNSMFHILLHLWYKIRILIIILYLISFSICIILHQATI